MIPDLAQKYFDLIGVVFVALDKNGRISRINSKGCEILGWKQEELIGKNWFATCLPEDEREETVRVFRKIIEGEEPGVAYFDSAIRTKTEKKKFLSWHNTVLRDDHGTAIGTLSVGIDITERKGSEDALRQSRFSPATLLNNLPGTVYRCRNDRYWTMEFISAGCRELTGHTAEAFMATKVSFADLIVPEDRERVWQEVQNAIAAGEPYKLKYRIHTAQNETKWVQEQGQAIFTPGKKLKGLEGFIADVTESVKTQQALEENETRMRAIVDTAVDGIITIDEDGTIEMFNRAAERLFGYEADEVTGKSIKILMPLPYAEKHDSYLTQYKKTGKKKIIGSGRQVEGKRKDGTVFPMYLSVGEANLGKRRIYTGIAHDLTEQSSLQQRMLQTERLAVIGKMAAKVAHEVRNPLSSISLNAELLEEELQSKDCDSDEAQSLLQSMIREIDRVSALTDEYLQFSRLPAFAPAENDLNKLIRETMAVHTQELKQRNIDLKSKGLDIEFMVNFDRSQIRRLLLNLVRNAIEAMPEGGTLTISTDRVNQHSIIAVEDSGIGIPPDELDNIFTPFFSTKDYGTGLGLVISQQIVHEHDGRILCQSKPQKGTIFTVELPLKQRI